MTDDDLDEALRALAHPARRAILRLTAGRNVPATELAATLGIAAATASEHLRVLRKTGLVVLTAQGTWRRYRADSARAAGVVDALLAALPTPTPSPNPSPTPTPTPVPDPCPGPGPDRQDGPADAVPAQ
jgi:DNA-binding transcriptional ArsR family regulator